MGFDPLKERGTPVEYQYRDFDLLALDPYDLREVHPYTRCRIAVMQAVEIEAVWFSHQMARHQRSEDVRRRLARTRRIEQQQEKALRFLKPPSEDVLIHSIGCEQAAVELTAWLARHEPDPNLRAALEFALIEDLDHLYRLANAVPPKAEMQAERIVGGLTEVMPGRPAPAEHRHPFESVRSPLAASRAQMPSLLHVWTITAVEQRSMSCYLEAPSQTADPLLRKLFCELAMLEEQHLSHYESLLDPGLSWFARLLLHEYNECLLYHDLLQAEEHPGARALFEQHLAMEIGHLQEAAVLFERHEDRPPSSLLPAAPPEPVRFEQNTAFIREVLAEQILLTARDGGYARADELPSDDRYFRYNKMVSGEQLPSRQVVIERIDAQGEDYRFETAAHPVRRFRDRKAVPRV